MKPTDERAREIEAQTRLVHHQTIVPAREALSKVDRILREYLAEYDSGLDPEDTGIRNLRALVAEQLAQDPPPKLRPFSARPDTLPSPPPPDEETPPKSTTLRPAPPAPPSRPRVMVVSSSPEVVEQVTALLSTEGIVCARARNGVEALAKLLGGSLEVQIPRPHVLLLEVAMPVLSGPAVVRALELTPYADIPVVLLSSGSQPPHAEDDHRFVYTGPLEASELVRTIRYWLTHGGSG